MLEPVTVTFERKQYTWDGRRWYGTDDFMLPPQGMIHKLAALIPASQPKPKPPVDTPAPGSAD